jgi:hypothetical protein
MSAVSVAGVDIEIIYILNVLRVIKIKMNNFIFLITVVSGITAAILYSDLFTEIRNWWWSCFDKCSYKLLNKAKYLSVCSLCLSFHITNIIQWTIIPFSSMLYYVFISFGVSFVTWGLCSFVNMCLWIKCYFEQSYEIERDHEERYKKSM